MDKTKLLNLLKEEAVIYQNEPPTAKRTGDVWIHTNDDNKPYQPYRWSGSEWESIRDLLEYINNKQITTAFKKVPRQYA